MTTLAAKLGLPTAALLVVAAIFYARGCQLDTSVATSKQGQQSKLREADRADALLKAAANQLNDLPSAVDTDLHPPTIVLDSLKSSDRQDVYAVCVANPAMPDHPINVIRVPTANSRFRSLSVRPGDILKFYVLADKTVDEDSAKSGLSRQVAMNLKIKQVIDDNTLIIEGGLNQEVDYPSKIEVWRYLDIRLSQINENLVKYDDRRLPPLGWEPAGDDQVLTQVLAWLNQWLRQSNPPADWKPDQLLGTLDAKLSGDAEPRRD